MKFLFIALMMITNLVHAASLDGNDPSLKVIQILDKGLIQGDCHDDHSLSQSSDDRLDIKDSEKYNRSPAVDKLFIKRIMKQSIQGVIEPMKIAITLLFLVSAFSSFAANEKKNLAILMMNGSVKISSLEEKLNGKKLGVELAEGMLAKAENVCDEPRSISSDDNHVTIKFEDCVLTIKKKKSETVAIQYQIRTKVKNGKSKSFLRKKTLKASLI